MRLTGLSRFIGEYNHASGQFSGLMLMLPCVVQLLEMGECRQSCQVSWFRHELAGFSADLLVLQVAMQG